MAYQGPDGTGKLGDMKPEFQIISEHFLRQASDCRKPVCIVGQSDRSQLLHSESCERELSFENFWALFPNISIIKQPVS